MPHRLDLGRVAYGDGGKVRLLEISVDPVRLRIDERYRIYADIQKIAEMCRQVCHIPFDRRENTRALEIHLRLSQLRLRLREGARAGGGEPEATPRHSPPPARDPRGKRGLAGAAGRG